MENITGSMPLVSIVVITYNSAKYVLETLDSIKNQTYTNIELVISDDCSKDNTVALCQEWLTNNQQAFTRAVVVGAKKNGGIPANCNQGLRHSSGTWVKLIAGDDFLLPDCIEVFYQATLQHPDASSFVSDMYVMHDNMVDQLYQVLAKRLPKDASRQLDNFIRYKSLPGPALFIKKSALSAIGGFNEKYPGVEDYPMYIAMTLAGYYFVHVNIPTIIYRVHTQSVTQTGNSFFANSINAHFDQVVRPLLASRHLYSLTWHQWLDYQLAMSKGGRKFATSLLTRLTDIVYWTKKFMPLLGLTPHAQIKIINIAPVSLDKLLLTPGTRTPTRSEQPEDF